MRDLPVEFGTYEARKRGTRRLDLRDPYRLAVALSWRHFILTFLAAELVLNLGFALLYVARPGAVANAHPRSLADAFFFSIETLATVGYGEMYPADLYGHVVSAVEIVVGVAFTAVVTGVIFVRASRPRSCFQFAPAIVVATHRGRPTLMIRFSSDQPGLLYDATAKLSVLLPDAAEDGSHVRNIADLTLLRDSMPVLPLSWTVMHAIDEASPLFGLDAAAMEARRLHFFLMVRAEDATLATTVRDLRSYQPSDIRFGMRYVDATLIDSAGRSVLDLDRLGLVEAEA